MNKKFLKINENKSIIIKNKPITPIQNKDIYYDIYSQYRGIPAYANSLNSNSLNSNYLNSNSLTKSSMVLHSDYGNIKKRGFNLFDGIAGLFGYSRNQAEQVQNLKFNTTIKNESSFKNSLKLQNETISEMFSKIATKKVTQLTQIQNYDFSRISSFGNINIDLSSTQELDYFDYTTITIDAINEVVSSLSSTFVNQILNDFYSQTQETLNMAVSQDNTNSVLNSLFSNQPYTNIKQNIEKNTDIRTVIENDIQTTIANMTSNKTVNEIYNDFKSSFDQLFTLKLSELSAKGDVNISSVTSQSMSVLMQTITKINIQNKIIGGLNSSSIFSVDNSVINACKSTDTTSNNLTNNNETLGSLAQNIFSGLSMSLLPFIVSGGLMLIIVFLVLSYRVASYKNSTENTARERVSVKNDDNEYATGKQIFLNEMLWV